MRPRACPVILARLVVTGLAAAALAGCAPPSASETPAASLGPSPGAAATTDIGTIATDEPEITIAPIPSLPEGEPCAQVPAQQPEDACPMPAGDYHSRRFGTGVRFSLLGGLWQDVANEPDSLSIFDNNLHWLTFVSGPIQMQGPTTQEPVSDPARAIKLLAEMPDISVTRRAARTIGGKAATVFDVTLTGEAIVTLFQYPSGNGAYFVDPDTTVRFHWLSIGGTPTIVLIEAPRPEFAAFVATQKQFLDSIAFD